MHQPGAHASCKHFCSWGQDVGSWKAGQTPSPLCIQSFGAEALLHVIADKGCVRVHVRVRAHARMCVCVCALLCDALLPWFVCEIVL